MLAFVYDVPRPPFPSFPSLSSLYPNIPLFSLLYKHFPSFYLYKRSRNHVHSLARILLCLTLISIIPRSPKSSRLRPDLVPLTLISSRPLESSSAFTRPLNGRVPLSRFIFRTYCLVLLTFHRLLVTPETYPVPRPTRDFVSGR